MAITLRNRKGSPLTQQELDVNFTEFFYSSSVEGSLIKFHRFQYDTGSNNFSASIAFPIDPPSGLDGYIQLKKGNAPSGSEATLTASADFSFDYQNSLLQVTGSGNISGDLVVGGTVTAQEFKSELVSSSIVYQSGSTSFGDSSDDIHTRTGSFNIKGNTFINGALNIAGVTNVKNSINRLNATASAHETDSGSFSTRVTANESAIASLDSTYATDAQLNASSSDITSAFTSADTNLSSSLVSTITNLSSSVSSTYLLNTTDTLAGDLTVTGTLTAQEFNTEYVSSSIIFESGSTKFGDTADDIHTFTGSVNISQNITVAGNITGNITGSATNASTASYVLGSSVAGAVTLASTASSANFNGGLKTTSDVQFDSLGIGVAASGVTGEIRATADIIAYYSSDERLKENIEVIPDALSKVKQIKGVSFDWKENISDVTSKTGHDIGVIAQDIEAILPELVDTRDSGYKAVSYEKIVALLIEAIKDQQLQIDELKSKQL